MYYKQFDKEIKLSNKNLQKILDFYLFSCPTPETSKRTRTFEQLGWKGAKQFAGQIQVPDTKVGWGKICLADSFPESTR